MIMENKMRKKINRTYQDKNQQVPKERMNKYKQELKY